MDFETFKKQALLTESRPEALSVSPAMFIAFLELAITVTKIGDLVKKAAFYGKAIDAEALQEQLGIVNYLSDTLQRGAEIINDPTDNGGMRLYRSKSNPGELPPTTEDDTEEVPMSPTMFNMRLAHAFIGKFTESGETIEALLKAVVSGKPIDRVNIGEEIGDGAWYDAVALDELDLKMETDCLAPVAAKLEARYNGSFSVEKALARDLLKEREVLEHHIET